VPNIEYSGVDFKIPLVVVDSAEIFIPQKCAAADTFTMLLHFHGASYIGKYAVSHCKTPAMLVNIDIGQGSSTYEKPFKGKNHFPEMLAEIKRQIFFRMNRPIFFNKIIISSFSAGYGSVRTILRSPKNTDLIDGIILLDGMHTDYTDTSRAFPENLNVDKLNMYVPFAKKAIEKKKIFIITHSEIFPGQYASNHETSDYLLYKLKLSRKKCDKFLTTAMHQISEAKKGQFYVFGFDGDTARDHVDHFHALPYWFNFVIGKFNSK